MPRHGLQMFRHSIERNLYFFTRRLSAGTPGQYRASLAIKSFTPLHPLRLDSGDRHRVDDILNGGAA